MISLYDERAYLVMARDITERKQTTEFIRKLEQAVRQSPASIIITDSKGNIEYANQKFTDMSGYELDEVKGKNPRFLKSGKMKPEIYTSMWETITQGLVWRGELLNRSRNGNLYWEAASISPIFDENQIITHYLAVKEDITQRKADEERLRKSEANLREANATKDKFFSIIAHDLKNPFNVILGFSNLLLNEYDDFDEQEKKEFIANIHEASASSFRLLQNLLDWSRTQTGTIKYYPEIVDVKMAVEEILSLNNSVALNKEINIKTYFSGKLEVLADHNMLLTILRNLVSNALKFTPRGGKVEIKCMQTDDCLRVSVSDNGIGIPKEQMDLLFKIDEQVQRSGTESERGTGLGLILCSEFVKKNGGTIWVESEEGKGSTFFFTLNYS
jgi:PAS domain S-box-containing protein